MVMYQVIAVFLHVFFRPHGKVSPMKATPFTVKRTAINHLDQLADCDHAAARRTANKTAKRSARTYQAQQRAARRLIEGAK